MANMCRLDMKPASMSRSFKLSNGNMNFLSLSCKYKKRKKSLNDRILNCTLCFDEKNREQFGFHQTKQKRTCTAWTWSRSLHVQQLQAVQWQHELFVSFLQKRNASWVALKICMSKKQRVSCNRFLHRTHATCTSRCQCARKTCARLHVMVVALHTRTHTFLKMSKFVQKKACRKYRNY